MYPHVPGLKVMKKSSLPALPCSIILNFIVLFRSSTLKNCYVSSLYFKNCIPSRCSFCNYNEFNSLKVGLSTILLEIKMSEVETIGPCPVPSTNDFDQSLQKFAQMIVTDLKIPEYPSDSFKFQLCIKKSFANPNGILECVASTHLKIHGYLAKDMRSDRSRGVTREALVNFSLRRQEKDSCGAKKKNFFFKR